VFRGGSYYLSDCVDLSRFGNKTINARDIAVA
jgi:hypothetical protein